MLIKKNLFFDDDLKNKKSEGIKKLAKAVKATLGPGGKPVMIERKNMTPLITKDGVTVAKHIALKDPVENLAVQTVLEAAEKTNMEAGDGTTSTVMLVEALFNSGVKAIEFNKNESTVDLNLEIEKSIHKVLNILEENKKEIDDIEQIKNIGTISANGDEFIGNLIAEAIDKVGEDGLITLEESGTSETFVRYTDGFEIPKGYLSNYFITNEQDRTVEYGDMNIFIYDGIISNMDETLPLLDLLINKEKKPFLIIAHDVQGMVLDTLILNKNQADMQGFVIKAPNYGPVRTEILKDIAVLTGATVIQPQKGDKLSESANKNNLGGARKVASNSNSTKIINGYGNEELIQQRVEVLNKQIDTIAKYNFDKEIIRERISRLTGGAAVVAVGGVTELEMKEKKDRIEDALNATRSAIEEGILPGGGVALLRAAQQMTIETMGDKIVQEAIRIPFRQILENAGRSVDVILDKILSKKQFYYGFDVRNNKYGDLYKIGVIDPYKVVKNSLLNSSSIANLLLNNNAAIVLDADQQDELNTLLEQQQ